MSIEAMKRVVEAFDALPPDHPARYANLQINLLRTALQQTAQPVEVTDEREAFEAEMRCEDVWGHRSLKKRADGRYENWIVDLMWDVWQARSKLTILALHPAPGVPDDVARDAERWRVSELISEAALKHPDSRTEAENTAFNAYRAAISSGNSYTSCIDAAIAKAKGRQS